MKYPGIRVFLNWRSISNIKWRKTFFTFAEDGCTAKRHLKEWLWCWKTERWSTFFICPHLCLSSSALGLSWLALQEEKIIFEHYCYYPIFHGGGDQNAHPWLGFWTFSYGKLKRSHVVLCLSGRMHHRGSFESEWGKKLKQYPVGNTAQGQKPQGWKGFHKGWYINKRGKGRCKSVEQSLSCGRKARGSSGLQGKLQEQNIPCPPLALEGPHPHKHPWPSSGWLDDPICSENVIH